MIRAAVLASGGGSNLQAILDHLDALGHSRPLDIVLVASNRSGAGALDRARRRGIPAEVITPADASAILALFDRHAVQMVILAGYLRLVPQEVISRFRGAILNVHPALLPKFGGAGMYGHRVHEAVVAAGETESGATVHLVSEEYDRGAIVAQSRVPVHATDTAETLASRVLAAEHALYPRVVCEMATRLNQAADSTV
jgi:formyltetrahydrofolate-dependent phosphoribosylglycinamide formyltransferase